MIRRPFSTAMIDMLLCTVIALFIAVAPPKANEGVEAVADFQLTMRWGRGLAIDEDIYILTPDNKVIWYGNKHEGNINIDRDDLGIDNDTDDNVETIYIREPKDGKYYVTIHSYGPEGMVPVGTVTISLQDRHGVQPFVPITVPMPEHHTEVPIIWFEVRDGKVVSSGASNVMIRSAGRAVPDEGEDGSGPRP